MPRRRIETAEIDAVVDAVDAFPQGASLEDVASRLNPPLHKRTLQRRLEKLAKDNRIRRTGKGTKTRYLPRVAFSASPDTAKQNEERASLSSKRDEEPKLTLTLDVSSEGKEVFKAVVKLRQERTPVTYQRAFLEAYRPNRTFYLPQHTRQQLAQIGRVTDEIQPAGTYARDILDRLLIELSFNSSRLEGNRYSLLETKQLIEAGKTATGKAAEETQMIMNHKAAIEFLVESAEMTGVNRHTVQNLHAILSDNLLGDPGASGKLRRKEIVIGGSVYRPLAVPQLVEEIFLQVLNVGSQIDDPFEQSFFLSIHLPYLQPFEDVNKRVSRLSANIPLIRNNLKPLSFVDVPKSDYAAGLLGVYELNRPELMRDVFAWAYQRSAEQYAAVRGSLGAPDEFKLRYRQQIKCAVADVIRNRVPAKDAPAYISNWAKGRIPEQEQSRFAAVVESELIGLHDWNIARFPVTPNEYKAWLAAAE